MAKPSKSNDDSSSSHKVGSDPRAASEVGGKGDFGIPARDNIVRAREGDIEGRPAGSAPGYSGAAGVRTTGAGSMGGAPGTDSGGDLDPDIIGFDGKGGLAAKPPREEETTAADATDGSSDTFASGGHAEGRNSIRRGAHGTAPLVDGDSVDHSGEDTSTNNPNDAGSVKSMRGDDPGGEGEINADEAEGDVEQGGEQ